MALDRQTIEKRDFPIGRRGYEPEAVDAHLARLADQIDDLQRSSGQSGRASLAATASAQVQAIVEAAETSAASIETEARDDAARIRKEATDDASRTRDQAVGDSQDHVGKVREATSHMLSRVDAMEGELGALIESLRTGANRLSADLALLEGNMGDLFTAAGGVERGATPAPAPAPEAAPAAEEPREESGRRVTGAKPTPVEPEPTAEAAATASGVAQGGDDEPGDEVPESYTANGEAPTAVEEPEAEPEEEPAAAAGESDVEGARLVALNMALNGQTRDETDRYLEENFQLSDRSALLDEVYATVE